MDIIEIFLENKAILAIISAIASAVVAWWLTSEKYQFELKKLELEVANAKYSQQEIMRNKEKEYLKIEEDIENHIIQLILFYKNEVGKNEFSPLWKQLKYLLYKGYLKTIQNYISSHDVFYKIDKKTKFRFIEDRLFMYLRTLSRYMAILNDSRFIEKAGEEKVVLPDNELSPFNYYVMDNTRFYHLSKRWRLKNHLKKVKKGIVIE